MSGPRVVVDLDGIEHNTRVLASLMATRGIEIVGVSKAVLGAPEVVAAMVRGGAHGIGDSRVENLERCELNQGVASMMLRAPLADQVERVVACADVSCNSEHRALHALGEAARRAGRVHGVLIMIELGDLREGAMPSEVPALVRRVLENPHLALAGIGTNLACQSGVVPDVESMSRLSRLADELDAVFGIEMPVVSGGNSANLGWALSGASIGRVNQLRFGEAILLGTDPLAKADLSELQRDAFSLHAEIIESRCKPAQPFGAIGPTAFGPAATRRGRGVVRQALLAVGRQDVDPSGLLAPKGVLILGASSDHLVVDVDAFVAGGGDASVGAELSFGLDYAALMRVMTSPFVQVDFRSTIAPAAAMR